MKEISVYNTNGEVVGKEKLSDKVFGIAIKPRLVQQVIVAMNANRRQILAHTKTRGEVRGGGRKPWKQKHTGRARHGSIRSPIWVGGGIVFGPRKDRNYHQKINKKVAKKALLMALSDKVANDKLVLLDSLKLDQIKTKEALTILRNLQLRVKIAAAKDRKKAVDKKAVPEKKKIEKPKKVMLLIPKKDENILKSFRNLDRVKPLSLENINLIDIVNYPYLVMPLASVKRIEEIFGK